MRNKEIITRPVREMELFGTLCMPGKPGPWPCILLLSGSSGTIREQEAALLAVHGYNVLALAYFGHEGLPRHLEEILLEYFARAIIWLHTLQSGPRQRVAVIGTSKGAEAALLLGATFPEVNAVVAYAPSAYVYQGLGKRLTSSWSYKGQPIPFITYEPAPRFEAYEKHQLAHNLPIACRGLYLETLEHTEQLPAATIPVECIQGPILLISGEDDQMWPGTLFAQQITQRLQEKHFAFPYQHLNYAHAGHKISIPYQPTTTTKSLHPVSGVINEYGGTPQGNAYASEHSWQALLAFLARHL